MKVWLHWKVQASEEFKDLITGASLLVLGQLD